ncbi:hypothetical protein Nepgr_005566 [Nepenthes gracilis]|uniref:RRM domain-containing protein n=1 Tax=Nepenthes gracilis TaxID=150966 RepID=A0AAD3S3D2_NEPGR|nr:hypothetical protein Nepgr_005566 [Nepenthes gracilis]
MKLVIYYTFFVIKCIEGFASRYVVKFLKSQRKEAGDLKFTNLYVTNLDKDLTEDAIRTKFSEFRAVFSAAIMRDSEGNSKGFSFVSFKSAEDARKAVEALNGAPLRIYLLEESVCREGTKGSRKGRDVKNIEKRVKACNVNVKNLDRRVNANMLKAYFNICGKVTSVKEIRRDNGSTSQEKNPYVRKANDKEDSGSALNNVSSWLSVKQFTSSTSYIPSYALANHVFHVDFNEPKLFAENLQPGCTGKLTGVARLELPEAELFRLFGSSDYQTALVEKAFLIAGGGNSLFWR